MRASRLTQITPACTRPSRHTIHPSPCPRLHIYIPFLKPLYVSVPFTVPSPPQCSLCVFHLMHLPASVPSPFHSMSIYLSFSSLNTVSFAPRVPLSISAPPPPMSSSSHCPLPSPLSCPVPLQPVRPLPPKPFLWFRGRQPAAPESYPAFPEHLDDTRIFINHY